VPKMNEKYRADQQHLRKISKNAFETLQKNTDYAGRIEELGGTAKKEGYSTGGSASCAIGPAKKKGRAGRISASPKQKPHR